MEIIAKEKLVTLSDYRAIIESNSFDVRRSDGCPVDSFMELVRNIAALNYENPNFVLLFRGQGRDYKRKADNTNISTIKPSIFRDINDGNDARLIERFDKLELAERNLVEKWSKRNLPSIEKLQRQQILRWSILQHYQICATPLLDVTQSLRVACSFASEDCNSDDPVYLFVLGVPNISGAITASAEAGLQIVRLSSVCPPQALRPHIQEGYLIGDYPDVGSYDKKQYYAHFEIDCGRRILAKFRFSPHDIWSDKKFPRIPKSALYPNVNDDLFFVADELQKLINSSHGGTARAAAPKQPRRSRATKSPV